MGQTLEEEHRRSRGLLVGVGVLGVGGFGHLLLLAHISQSVLGFMLFAGEVLVRDCTGAVRYCTGAVRDCTHRGSA
jgi:hypothetical protein